MMIKSIQQKVKDMWIAQANKENLFIILAYRLIIFSAIIKLFFIGRPLIGHYDSEGQLYSLMAMSLNKYGFFKLAFIPVNNSGLLTNPPDYYAHWPLLYPNFLAWAFHIFGQKVEIGRLITAIASTLSYWLLFDIVKRNYSERMAFFTIVFFIMAPINLYYSFWIGRTFIALALWVAAIRSFLICIRCEEKYYRHLFFACIWFAMATLISWEPIVTIIGLTIIYFISKDMFSRKAALACMVALVIPFVAHHVYIMVIAPHLLVDQFNAYLIRSYSQTSMLPPRPFLNWLFLIAYNMYISFGIIILMSSFLGLILLIKSWIKQNKSSHKSNKNNIFHMKFDYSDTHEFLFLIILLISMPLFWFLAAPRQGFDHDYECILWIPFICLTAAYLWDYFFQRQMKPIIIIVIICIVSLIGTESFIGFKRYYRIDYSNEYSKIINLKDRLKDTDILIVSQNDFSKPTTAFLTGCLIVKVISKEQALRFIKLRTPNLAGNIYYMDYKQSNIQINENQDDFLYYFKNKLIKYYKPLKWKTYPELSEWVKDNFSREELPGGLILYDMNSLKELD
ncbi:MAG: ArnT family glycosyltransferase [Desulfobaccales bacterium]